MSAPRVVGLDLSLTATGVALADGTTEILKSRQVGMDRLREIKVAALSRCMLEGAAWADLIVIEGYSMGTARQSSHAHALGELGGVIRLSLHVQGACYVDVPPASLKKYATGKGNANKELMLVSAVKRLGYEGSDSNEADALWLRAMGLHALGHPIVDLPQSHLERIDMVAWPPGTAA